MLILKYRFCQKKYTHFRKRKTSVCIHFFGRPCNLGIATNGSGTSDTQAFEGVFSSPCNSQPAFTGYSYIPSSSWPFGNGGLPANSPTARAKQLRRRQVTLTARPPANVRGCPPTQADPEAHGKLAGVVLSQAGPAGCAGTTLQNKLLSKTYHSCVVGTDLCVFVYIT